MLHLSQHRLQSLLDFALTGRRHQFRGLQMGRLPWRLAARKVLLTARHGLFKATHPPRYTSRTSQCVHKYSAFWRAADIKTQSERALTVIPCGRRRHCSCRRTASRSDCGGGGPTSMGRRPRQPPTAEMQARRQVLPPVVLHRSSAAWSLLRSAQAGSRGGKEKENVMSAALCNAQAACL